MTYWRTFDTMSDKGYGNFGKIHTSRQRNQSFPYNDPDDPEILDDENDLDTKQKILKKTGQSIPVSDFMSGHGTDKFYFVSGNTKLKECFDDVNVVLEKITSYARMFSPVPKLNRGKRTGPGGASFPGGVGNFKGIGMTQGWSSPPPEFDDHFLDRDEYDDECDACDEY